MVSHDFDKILSYVGQTVNCDLRDDAEEYEDVDYYDVEDNEDEEEGCIATIIVNDRHVMDEEDWREFYEYAEDVPEEEVEYPEEADWTMEAILTIEVDYKNVIRKIEPEVRVYGDDGLGESDPEDMWNMEDIHSAEDYLARITKPEEDEEENK